jgi:cytochrome d ubiquinol oxidase subunit II
VLVGWVLAQRPDILPGLSIHEAAAPRSTLIAIVVATVIGAVLLVPSLVILYGLLLGGVFDTEGRDERASAEPAPPRSWSKLLPVAAALFGLGALLTVFFDQPVTLTLGILSLFGFGVCGFLVLSAPLESDRS